MNNDHRQLIKGSKVDFIRFQCFYLIEIMTTLPQWRFYEIDYYAVDDCALFKFQ